MELDFLAKGIVLGFSIAAPVGPIGILCIRRTLVNGKLAGLFTGFGAATADAFYGAVAGFGLTSVSSVLINNKLEIQLIGILFLLYLSFKIFFEKTKNVVDEKELNRGLLRDYLSTFILTLTNPTTIISFLAVFAGIGILNTSSNYEAATSLVLGVFLGSMIWWLILSNGISLVRKKMDSNLMQLINRISGIIIFTFAMFLFLGLLG